MTRPSYESWIASKRAEQPPPGFAERVMAELDPAPSSRRGPSPSKGSPVPPHWSSDFCASPISPSSHA